MDIRSSNKGTNGRITGCWLVYGPPGCGKTRASLTCPGRVCLVNSEAKDPMVSLGDEGRKKDITIIDNADYYEIMAWLNKQIETPEFGTVYMDGLTVTMANYRSTLADDRSEIKWAKMTDREKSENKNWIRDKLSVEQADWGLMAEMMLRQTKLLNTLSKKGVLVVATAISQESPKWDRSLGVGPSLLGRDYSTQVHGLFDFIGFITRPWSINEDGTISSPRISFHSPDNQYLARAAGKLAYVRGAGPLNFTKLLELINQEDQVNETQEAV